ncbi:hypothetical protein IQ07DRAFT_252119 [Pyrenochaeta sp. DS3sAY3a]|nr:hypothetical protein IQ07DRAFT_252119 [Pyrenochaeta sp. DS3sAY3a]
MPSVLQPSSCGHHAMNDDSLQITPILIFSLQPVMMFEHTFSARERSAKRQRTHEAERMVTGEYGVELKLRGTLEGLDVYWNSRQVKIILFRF